MNGKDQLQALYQKYQDNQCSEEEFLQLLEVLSSENEEARQEVLSLFEATWNNLKVFPGQFNLPETQIPASDNNQEDTGINEHNVISIKRSRSWIKYIAAAAVFILLAVGLWWFKSQDKQPTNLAVTPKQQEIPPGREGAILTLADGRQIILDSTQGNIARDGGASIVNKEGKLTYQKENAPSAEVVYNLMTTPRGRTYSLVLSDGTKVWLNASSSIRYPTAFTGSERSVDITGEAYFEVKHNAAQPFKVHLPNGGIVEDLGTAFNINAYSDEPDIKTTLLEGSVKVTAKGNSQPKANSQQLTAITLLPGQQAILTNSYQLTANSSPDLEQVMAWKNGFFNLSGQDFREIMRQVSRWYDVDVQYQGDVSGVDFYGTVSRRQNVSELLKIMEKTGIIHFKIEGRNITVFK